MCECMRVYICIYVCMSMCVFVFTCLRYVCVCVYVLSLSLALCMRAIGTKLYQFKKQGKIKVDRASNEAIVFAQVTHACVRVCVNVCLCVRVGESV